MAYFWDVDITEVSLVKRPANRRRFILLKREEAGMPNTRTPEQERELEKQFDLDKWIREVKDIVSSLADKLDEFVGKDKIESLPADIKSLLVSLKETLGIGAYPYPYARGAYPYPYARGPYPYPYARKAEEKTEEKAEEAETEQMKQETPNTDATDAGAKPSDTQPTDTQSTEAKNSETPAATATQEPGKAEPNISKEVEQQLIDLISKITAQIDQLSRLLGGEG